MAENKRVTPQMFLDRNPGSDNNAANRLRWMLKETMGADGAFERRREELSIIRACEKQLNPSSRPSSPDVVSLSLYACMYACICIYAYIQLHITCVYVCLREREREREREGASRY